MKLSQKVSNKKSLIAIISTTVFFLSFISYFTMQTSAQNITVKPIEENIIPAQIEQNILLEKNTTTKQPALVSGIPINIKIPKIKVDALIENLGLASDGAVDSPVGPENAGWWNGGPIPGAIGNAIIDGHSGWKNNVPAVFDNLKNLKKGDKIYVTSNTGVTTTFIVNKLKIYNKNDEALDVFISDDDKSHLNLITCSGLWDNIFKGRDSRLVVFADLENNEETLSL